MKVDSVINRINHYSRLVFTSDGVGIGIVSELSRTTESESESEFSSDSVKNSVAYDKLKTRLSESEAEAEG